MSTSLPILNVTDQGNHVLLTAPGGRVEITPLVDHTVRLRLQRGRGARLRPDPAAVCAGGPAGHPSQAPPVQRYRLGPEAGGLRLRAEDVSVRVEFSPLRLQLSAGAEPTAELEFAFAPGRTAVRQRLQPDEVVYGLGEKSGWLDRRFRRYRMRTTDVLLVNPEMASHTDPLYASFPVWLAHGPHGSYGFYLDSSAYTTFDFSQPGLAECAAPADQLTAYFFAGPALPDVLRQYTALTGRLCLPPLWALGYHQCRWGYASEADIRRVAGELRARGLPADAIWFDIDYMDGYRVFTWDGQRFPRPAELVSDLKAHGLRSVTIVDPGVKVDRSYAVYRDGRRAGHFVRHPDGREYHGRVWPGPSAFPDFHRPETRDWWAGLAQDWVARYGLAGLWIDMNEPASTDLSGPVEEALHAGGKLPHSLARNTYALEMARATRQGLTQQDPEARPFLLTRSAFSGAQALTALWGGDNHAAWEHLAASLPLLLSLGLSGMPFVGVDIGGFAGDTHGELLARWFQAGALYPFCRNHAAAGTNHHEPWAFGPQVEAICRAALQRRYRLLPYLYNLFHQAAQTGAPVMRPLVWHYPDDPAVFNLNDQFLLGPDLLAAPVLQPGITARAVYLPHGSWHRWDTGEVLHGPAHHLAPAPLEDMPLFVRAGAILPLWPPAPHTDAVERAGLELHLWPGDGRLDYYEDDGATQGHTRGAWRRSLFRLQAGGGGLSLRWGASTGRYRDGRTHWSFVFHGLPPVARSGGRASAELDGRRLRLERRADGLLARVPDDGRAHRLELTGAA